MSSEYHSVEKPLIKTLGKLGWDFISQADNLSLRDCSVDEVFLKPYVIDGLMKHNAHKGLDKDDCEQIYSKLKKIEDNEEFHAWLKGEKSYKPNADSKAITIDLIDKYNPDNNQYVVTNQFVCSTINSDKDKTIRPDLVLFVNGLPITVIECKFLGTEGSNYTEGIKQLDRYQKTTPKLFVPNSFNISTDGHKLKYGATKSPQQYFLEWKDYSKDSSALEVDSEFEKYANENKTNFNPYIDKQVFGLLNKTNFIDLITNFIVFETRDNLTVKKIARYQQFRAVNKIVERVVSGEMKSGLIWHTQGSGKSLTMLFTSWKLRTLPQLNNPTILIVVDRIDLDEQISGTFGAVKLPNTTRANSIEGLKKKLKEDRREVIISTIFKFDRIADVLLERENVIILIDEAHRSQEGTNSAMMRKALPNAFFFGFTGTPIDKMDKNTHRNFGLLPSGKIERYMDLYNIKSAIDDGATVPVHYQVRAGSWQIDNSEQLEELIELDHDHLSDEEMDALKEESSSYGKTFMMNPKRLRAVAEDICSHYKAYIEPNGFKAQVVAFSREACVIIKEHIDEILEEQYSDVVFSGGQNDKPHLRKYHKSKQEIKDCTDLFKKKDSDLKIVIVQSMLLTGFDAPNEQVMYLDRPLKDHTLLQAIARTNRPYPNKECGIIIDYCGILKNLSKALNFDENDITDCLIDFDKLKEQLPKFLADFKEIYSESENQSPFGIAKYLQDNDKLTDFKETYKGVQLSYETLAPDPFVIDYRHQYVEATKLKMIVDSILSQEKPDVSEYLAKTREMIQEHIELGEINEKAPVFVVDDSYLKRLDGTELDKKDKELTLENRLRATLRIKAEDLPIYKTLQERLEAIIQRRDEEVDDTYSLLCVIMNDLNKAQEQELSSDLSKGERAISQLLSQKIDNDELVSLIASDIKGIVEKWTEDFNGWQLQDSIVANIRKEIIIKLFDVSKTHSAISKENKDYIPFAEQLMKYIIQHY